MSARTYVVGRPVVVTVHDDGTSHVFVDLSEVDDLWEGARPGYSPEVIEADIATVVDAITAWRIRVTS